MSDVAGCWMKARVSTRWRLWFRSSGILRSARAPQGASSASTSALPTSDAMPLMYAFRCVSPTAACSAEACMQKLQLGLHRLFPQSSNAVKHAATHALFLILSLLISLGLNGCTCAGLAGGGAMLFGGGGPMALSFAAISSPVAG